jgi:EmrB/QacA subfamily drug resistance transporter
LTSTEARQRWIRIAMCCVIGIVLLDETGVAIALSTMRTDLGVSQTEANWIISAYLLGLSGTVAAFGRLADWLGLRRVLIGGCLVFGAMSVAAGLAPSYETLIGARVLQGLGAAAAFPTSAGILRAITPPEQLGRAFGQYSTASAIGLASGPLIGGFLTEFVSWRAVFFLGVPVALFIVTVAVTMLQETKRADRDQSVRFDAAGLVLLVGTLTALVVGLMQGPVWGWTTPVTLALLGAGCLGFVLFVFVESRHAQPILEVDLFRDRGFSSANGMTFLAQFSKTAVIIYGALYLIDDVHLSTQYAGLALVPGMIAGMVSGLVCGRLVDRFGPRRPLLWSLAGLVASLFYFAATVHLDEYAWLIPGLVVWGFVNSGVFVASRRAVQAAVPATKAGQASGINSTAQWLGAALSVPTLGIFVVSSPPRFEAVYVASACVSVLALSIAWRYFPRPA